MLPSYYYYYYYYYYYCVCSVFIVLVAYLYICVLPSSIRINFNYPILIVFAFKRSEVNSLGRNCLISLLRTAVSIAVSKKNATWSCSLYRFINMKYFEMLEWIM